MKMTKPRTLFGKISDTYVVSSLGDDTGVLYVDRHLDHEVISPQALEDLRLERAEKFADYTRR